MHTTSSVKLALACWFTALMIAEASAKDAVANPIEVIYGRKYGMALTMDVFAPRQSNGRAVVFVVSGGFYSAREAIKPMYFQEVLDRGYVVFAVVHGSQPKFTIPEIITDMHRSIRYIRFHAKDFGVDPSLIGIMGGSAGGHLSLMQGTAGADGDPEAADPVERESSRVQAVACFFPPTDFLNYGKPGEVALGRGVLKDFRAPFEFEALDPVTRHFVPVTAAEQLEIGRRISPITHVTADDAPTMIMHGDADELVPIQQAKIMIDKLAAAGVDAELVVKPGAAHGWADLARDVAKFADWFDRTLGNRN